MKNDSPVKVYRLNPDGTKGEFIRTVVAFPPGWDSNENMARPADPEARRGRNQAPVDYYQKLYDNGMSDDEIGRLTGKSARTIRAWRSKNKLPSNEGRVANGTHGGGSKSN